MELDSSTELSRLERLGVRWLRHPVDEPSPSDETIYSLSEAEQRALRTTERFAIFRAGLAGACSAGASILAAWYAGDPELDAVRYWLWVGGITAFASILELSYLYFDGVRSVAKMAHAAGLPLDGEEVDDAITLGLARAALEIPTPPLSRSGVHAHQESNKLALVFLSLAYKLKVTVTNFLLKALVRRALGRAAARMYLEIIALPVTALWNAVVAYKVLKEARLRIVGCKAAPLIMEFIGAGHAQAELVVRAIACVTVRSARAHPNTEGLLGAIFQEYPEVPRGPELGDSAELIKRVRDMPARDVAVVLRAAVAASVIDGHLSLRERIFLEDLFEQTDAPLELKEVRAVCTQLLRGAGLHRDMLRALDPISRVEVAQV